MTFDVLGALVNISPRDLAGPLVGGLGGWFAALKMARSNEKIARGKRDDERDRHNDEAQASRGEDLSARMKILMDSYERRIMDLTSEVQTLRRELATMQQTLNDRMSACAGCPYFSQRREGHDGTD